MFDFIRNLAKSAEERRLETLNAYVDGELSAGERRQFEAQLAGDAALRAELAQLRQVKQGIQQLPRARAPRNFTLDPAVYGRPQPQPAFELYPALRVATALAAFFFIIAVVLDLATPAGGLGQPLAAVTQQEPAAEVGVVEEAADAARLEVTQAVEEVVVESEAVEVTRVVTESVEEEEMPAAEEEAPAEEEAMEVEMAEEPAEQLEEGAAAEDEAMTAPAEDEAAGEDVDDGEAPAAAAPAVVATATETATVTPQPAPTSTLEAPDERRGVEALPAEEPVGGGLPLLLIAEIVFGVGLVVLLTVTLFIRRNL